MTPKKASGSPSAASSRPPSSSGLSKKVIVSSQKSGLSTPLRGLNQKFLDLSSPNLAEECLPAVAQAPQVKFARERLLEEVKLALEGEGKKVNLGLVVIGHVDAGKSTLLGRLLYELGRIQEKTRISNERGSNKAGKGSFSWAWNLDGTREERERGMTMDVALQTLYTPKKIITVLDAPGHKDFIPNMISGASQADCALLVVDATVGEFESGFSRGGQTREHIVLVRSLGVSQVIVAVNKLDQVKWDESRYQEICGIIRNFLTQSGFQPSRTKYIPVGALQGINLSACKGQEATRLLQWYNGPTLLDLLDALVPPSRDIIGPFRMPIANLFKCHGTGVAVSGRLCSGVIQVWEKVRILPGDETALVKSIEVDEENRAWTTAGTNATLHLTDVDPVQLSIGNVLCSATDVVQLATTFTVRIVVFDITIPITVGTSVELFHHSRDVPATILKLIALIDRVSGVIVKSSPRVLVKNTSADVQITLRSGTIPSSLGTRPIPLETFAVNKEMGRILIRRAGETIAAGIIVKINS